MIAVDAMVIVAAILDGDDAPSAKAWRMRDPHWIAPLLWRSEVRNVLVRLTRRRGLSTDSALEAMMLAEKSMVVGTFDVSSDHVLRLAVASGCTAYDCEYVALAEARGVKLLTADRPLLAAFPAITVPFDAAG